ncbi:hypothetical protein CMK14_17475 [Candidatus Poribacteria bacterium]|nr:hypothetical protein [Candidatus Poribacteria bacterium]
MSLVRGSEQTLPPASSRRQIQGNSVLASTSGTTWAHTFRPGQRMPKTGLWEVPLPGLWHQFVGGVSCSSIVGLNKPHLLQRWRKKDGAYLPGKPDEDRLRRARLAWVQSLFPGPWQQQVSAAKTSV